MVIGYLKWYVAKIHDTLVLFKCFWLYYTPLFTKSYGLLMLTTFISNISH